MKIAPNRDIEDARSLSEVNALIALFKPVTLTFENAMDASLIGSADSFRFVASLFRDPLSPIPPRNPVQNPYHCKARIALPNSAVFCAKSFGNFETVLANGRSLFVNSDSSSAAFLAPPTNKPAIKELTIAPIRNAISPTVSSSFFNSSMSLP